MACEDFFLLCGGDFSKKTPEEVIRELHSKFSKFQITVLSFMPGIHYRDVGMDEKMTKLSLVKLRHPDDAKFPAGEETSKQSFRRIPKEVKGKTNSLLDLDILDVIPDVSKLIQHLTEKTGIACCKGKSGYWMTGQLYQVNIAMHYIKDQYHKISSGYHLTGSEQIDMEQIKKVEDFINGKVNWNPSWFSNSKVFGRHYSESTELPYMVLTYCTFPSGLTKDIKVSVAYDSDHSSGSEHVIQIAASTKGDRDTYLTNFHAKYNYVQKSYYVISLDPSVPNDYNHLLLEMLTARHKPILTIQRRKSKEVSLLLPRNVAQNLERLKSQYYRYNQPSKYCSLKLFDHHLFEEEVLDDLNLAKGSEVQLGDRCEVKSAQNTYNADTDRGRNTEKSISPNKDDTAEDELTHLTQNRFPEGQYLFLTKWSEIEARARESKVKVSYKHGEFEFYALYKNSSQLSEFDDYFNTLITSVVTTVVPVGVLDRYSGKDVLFVYCRDDGTLRVTGSREAIELIIKLHKESGFMDRDGSEATDTTSVSSVESQLGGQKKTHRRKRELVPASQSNRDGEEATFSSRLAPIDLEVTDLEEFKELAEGVTGFLHRSSGLSVQVGKGDLTKLKVDAIVNAANKNLKHAGGVAHVIAKAAGPRLQEDCERILENGPLSTGEVCVSDAGQLPCKRVIHAVGPAMDKFPGREEECLELLRRTFLNCLEEASRQNFRSIAIPAISSGMYGVPPKSVAEMAAVALKDFLTSEPNPSLRLVRFIDINESMITLFLQELNHLVGEGVLQEIL